MPIKYGASLFNEDVIRNRHWRRMAPRRHVSLFVNKDVVRSEHLERGGAWRAFLIIFK